MAPRVPAAPVVTEPAATDEPEASAIPPTTINDATAARSQFTFAITRIVIFALFACGVRTSVNRHAAKYSGSADKRLRLHRSG